jgi:hypothetical protein
MLTLQDACERAGRCRTVVLDITALVRKGLVREYTAKGSRIYSFLPIPEKTSVEPDSGAVLLCRPPFFGNFVRMTAMWLPFFI